MIHKVLPRRMCICRSARLKPHRSFSWWVSMILLCHDTRCLRMPRLCTPRTSAPAGLHGCGCTGTPGSARWTWCHPGCPSGAQSAPGSAPPPASGWALAPLLRAGALRLRLHVLCINSNGFNKQWPSSVRSALGSAPSLVLGWVLKLLKGLLQLACRLLLRLLPWIALA